MFLSFVLTVISELSFSFVAVVIGVVVVFVFMGNLSLCAVSGIL